MQKRKSHCKSRNGCLNCKRRHVKCDERGPPCANCIVRESTDTCTYVGPREPQHDNDSGSSGSNSTTDVLKLPRQRLSPPTTEAIAIAKSRRLLELELMYQWSTSTYKSLCCTSYDYETMQIQVPRWCLRDDFLMNGVFAIAALEISIGECDGDEAKAAFYAQAAMEYYDRGSAEFRAGLGDINKDNCTSMYMFSSLAWIISMAIPHDRNRHYHEKGILERTSMLMELIMGSSLIALRSVAWIMESPLRTSIQVVVKSFLEVEEPNTLDSNDQAAFARLNTLLEDPSLSTTIPPGTYENAVLQLRVLWREDIKQTTKGIAIAFPSLAAQDFATAVNESQPMALLILMHWAIMLHKLDVVDKLWWAKKVGQDLILEISDRLLESNTEVATLPLFWECVAWAREQAGLPVFGAMEL